MKLAPLTPALLLSLTLTVSDRAAAQSPSPTPSPTPGTAAWQAELEQRFDRQLTELERTTRARGGTREVLQRMTSVLEERYDTAVSEFSQAAVTRERLGHLVAEIEEQARDGWVEAQTVWELEVEVLEARLAEALEQLTRRARNGEVDRTTYERAVSLLEQRARLLAPEQPDSEAFHQRMVQTIREHYVRASQGIATAESVEQVELSVMRSRLVNFLTWLERRSRRMGLPRFYHEFFAAIYTSYATKAAERL